VSFSLRWTPEATKTLQQNADYLFKEWGDQVANDFLDRVEDLLDLIKQNPHIYPLHSSSKTVHKCIVNKRIILFFEIKSDNFINLLTFWNTYQDPEKLKL
jgi:plasmid stabilization system protein ParE